MAGKSKKLATIADAADAAEDVVNTAAKMFPGLSYSAFADVSRDNLAAVIKANLALSEGLEAIGKELIGYARTSLETASQAASAILGAKTFEEVVQLQTDLAKSNLETLLQGSAKLSELGVSVANEALAPLGGRVEATFAKFGKPLAA
jgi:phasin family protein